MNDKVLTARALAHAARANCDTEHRFTWRGDAAEVERLRRLVPLYPAWKIRELMRKRRA